MSWPWNFIPGIIGLSLLYWACPTSAVYLSFRVRFRFALARRDTRAGASKWNDVSRYSHTSRVTYYNAAVRCRLSSCCTDYRRMPCLRPSGCSACWPKRGVWAELRAVSHTARLNIALGCGVFRLITWRSFSVWVELLTEVLSVVREVSYTRRLYVRTLWKWLWVVGYVWRETTYSYAVRRRSFLWVSLWRRTLSPENLPRPPFTTASWSTVVSIWPEW